MRVLVTGGSGLVGRATLELLAERDDLTTVGTSRRGLPGLVAWPLGESRPPPELAGPWDCVIHTAADTRWTMTPAQARRANVDTVSALAAVVGPQTSVVHVSTAYATGVRGGARSADLADYRNAYEWSKAHAEMLAAELFPRLTIVRPPLIVGCRKDGAAARFAGMYTILRGIATSSIPVIAAGDGAQVDVIPVDDLATMLVGCIGEKSGPRLRVIACGKAAPTVVEVVDAMMSGLNEWREERGLTAFVTPTIVSPESWTRFYLPFARSALTARQNRTLDLLRNFEPYFALTDPLEPTDPVDGVRDAVRLSARFWADHNQRLAALAPRPWRGAA